MDIYGIGFSNIRMSNYSNDYTYKYNYRVNTFPEEVFLHEFIHTLERTAKEYGYDVPSLHDYEIYGYKEQRVVGLKDWYTAYMNKKVVDKNKNYVGLDESVYTHKPAHASDFTFPIEVKFHKEPKNTIQEIKSLINVLTSRL